MRKDVRCPLSAVRCPLSAVRCPLSAVRCPPSVVHCPPSAVRRPPSQPAAARGTDRPVTFSPRAAANPCPPRAVRVVHYPARRQQPEARRLWGVSAEASPRRAPARPGNSGWAGRVNRWRRPPR
ncbi:MAG: hypothetical protein DWI57_03560 [Chloroflexi bacterium]|nr:MAG: hypothetical protein DWI57_03560 [Chloroflexota bacterium]